MKVAFWSLSLAVFLIGCGTTPTPTPTQSPNDAFCDDLDEPLKTATLAVKRLGDHSLEWVFDLDLIDDPTWRNMALSLNQEVADAAKSQRGINYLPETEYLQPQVEELASHLEAMAVIYKQGIEEYDAAKIRHSADIFVDIVEQIGRLSRAHDGFCGTATVTPTATVVPTPIATSTPVPTAWTVSDSADADGAYLKIYRQGLTTLTCADIVPIIFDPGDFPVIAKLVTIYAPIEERRESARKLECEADAEWRPNQVDPIIRTAVRLK